MLQNIKELFGAKLAAADGDIGKIKDFYFDDNSWAHRWNPVPGSTGHQAPESGSEDEDAEGRSEAAQLFAEGVGEAAHDQMLQAARAAKKSDEPSP